MRRDDMMYAAWDARSWVFKRQSNYEHPECFQIIHDAQVFPITNTPSALPFFPINYSELHSIKYFQLLSKSHNLPKCIIQNEYLNPLRYQGNLSCSEPTPILWSYNTIPPHLNHLRSDLQATGVLWSLDYGRR